MNPLVEQLLETLDLERIDLDLFRGQNEKGRPGRLFGGQVAAQALVAAIRTVDDRRAHSLHGYFLRPGDPDVPVVYSVDRIRDGRSFTTRRVVAVQRGQAIFNMSVSFHMEEESYEHQFEMPEAPDPETVPTLQEYVERNWDKIPNDARVWGPRPRPIDIRHVDPPTYLGGEPRQGTNLVWFRVDRKLDDDPSLHQAVLTYVSDMSLLDNIVKPHGREGQRGPVMMASLDHALWFHRPVRVDGWLLYVQDSPAAAGARGFARGTIFTQGGQLVASVAQEGLLRPFTRPEDRSQ